MVKWRRAPASRDGTHPLGPRALGLRTTARPPRGDRAAARRAGARPGRGAEAVRRGRRAAPRGTRAADRRRGAGEAGAVGPGRPSQGRGLRRLTAPSRSTSWTPAPAWMRPSKHGAPAPTAGGVLQSRRRFATRSEEHTSELQSRLHLVCRLLLEKKKKKKIKLNA